MDKLISDQLEAGLSCDLDEIVITSIEKKLEELKRYQLHAISTDNSDAPVENPIDEELSDAGFSSSDASSSVNQSNSNREPQYSPNHAESASRVPETQPDKSSNSPSDSASFVPVATPGISAIVPIPPPGVSNAIPVNIVSLAPLDPMNSIPKAQPNCTPSVPLNSSQDVNEAKASIANAITYPMHAASQVSNPADNVVMPVDNSPDNVLIGADPSESACSFTVATPGNSAIALTNSAAPVRLVPLPPSLRVSNAIPVDIVKLAPLAPLNSIPKAQPNCTPSVPLNSSQDVNEAKASIANATTYPMHAASQISKPAGNVAMPVDNSLDNVLNDADPSDSTSFVRVATPGISAIALTNPAAPSGLVPIPPPGVSNAIPVNNVRLSPLAPLNNIPIAQSNCIPSVPLNCSQDVTVAKANINNSTTYPLHAASQLSKPATLHQTRPSYSLEAPSAQQKYDDGPSHHSGGKVPFHPAAATPERNPREYVPMKVNTDQAFVDALFAACPPNIWNTQPTSNSYPLSSSSESRKRKREESNDETPLNKKAPGDKFLNPVATAVLKSWYKAHIEHPYAKKEDLASMAEQGGITEKQVTKWLQNTRKRYGKNITW